MLYAILEVYGPQDPEFAANKIEADSELEALAKYAIDQGFADPRESFTKEDLISFGNSGYFYMTDGGVRMIFTNTELHAVEIQPRELPPVDEAYKNWREGVEAEMQIARDRGKTVKAEPASELEWQMLYREEPAVHRAAWYVLTGRRAGGRNAVAASREADRIAREISAGKHLLENIHDSLPAEIKSRDDSYDMLSVLLDHAKSLSTALYGYDIIDEAADAADTLADLDEGENIDVDRLREISRALKS